MDPAEVRRITEALKRLGDDDRAYVLRWLIVYYEDDAGCARRGLTGTRSSLDTVEYHLVRVASFQRTNIVSAKRRGRAHDDANDQTIVRSASMDHREDAR